MKHIIIIYFLILAIPSCKEDKKPSNDIMPKMSEIEVARLGDSITNATLQEAGRKAADSSGSWRSPVQVISSRIIREGQLKDVRLAYKNVSGKKIDAIRFKWYGVNAFGEPASNMGSALASGFGGGEDDRGLGIDKNNSGTWSVYGSDVKTVTSACAFEVVYADGSKWKFSN